MNGGATEQFDGVPAGLPVKGRRALTWPADEIRSQLLREMREARQQLLDHVTARFSQFEPYRGLAPSVAADVLASIRRLYDTFLACLAESRDFTPEELTRLDREGSKRARQGIPLEAVEAMFRAVLQDAMSMLHDLATDAVDDNASGLAVVAKLDMTLAGLALTAIATMAEGHRKLHGDVAQMIGEFVANAAGPRSLRASQAEPRYALAVLVPPHPTDVAVSVSAARALGDGRVLAAGSPPVHLPQLHTAVASSFTEDAELEDVCSRVAHEHGVGIVMCRFRSVGEAIRKYDIVKEHLDLVRAPPGAPQVLHGRDIAYSAMLHGLDDDLASMLLDSVLGATLELSETERSDVIEHLDCSLSVWGNKTEMARALGRHRHSVYNFLARIEELTGLRPDDARGALLLRLAVDIQRLHLTGQADTPARSRPSRAGRGAT